MTEAIRAMAMPGAVRREIRTIQPEPAATRAYPRFYERYRALGAAISAISPA